MKRSILTAGLAGALLLPLADAREIQLGDVRVTAPGTREGRATFTPWSGTWWPMASGELALGWNGTGADFTYDATAKVYKRATGSQSKATNDLSPMLKYDAWRKKVTGVDSGAALTELHGLPGFRHHVYGDEKERYDRDGISYGWWGHCNGWCAAALLEREPLGAVEVDGIRFEVADLKGLLSENHYSCESDFTGRRFYAPKPHERDNREPGKRLLAALNAGAPRPVAEYVAWYEAAYETTMSATARQAARPEDFRDELESFERSYADRYDRAYADLDPHVFHQILESVIGQRRLAFVADVTCNDEVWNHPAFAYSSTLERARDFTEGGAARTEWRARTVVHYATDGVDESVVGIEAFTRTYTYTLITDSTGKPIGGAWTGASVDDHPDFAWLPTFNRTTADHGENPLLVFGEVVKLLPRVHVASSGRALDATANGVAASSRREHDRTTTWTQPVAATSPDVRLGARVAAGQPIAKVVFFEQRVDTSRGTPVVARDPLVRLGESTSAPGFEVTARLAQGKRMVLAYGYDAAGKLVAVDEVTVEVGVAPPPPQADDAFEQNDTAGAAATLAAGAYPNLQCNDDDWYVVAMPSAGTLSVKLDFRHAEGDIELELVDASGAVLGSSTSATDAEDVSKAGLAAGTYLLRVHGYRGARAAYSLGVTVTPATTPPPTRTGTITASVLNVRRGPGTSYAIVTTVRQNAVVTLLEERAGWYRVTWTGAPSGELWVSGSYVRVP